MNIILLSEYCNKLISLSDESNKIKFNYEEDNLIKVSLGDRTYFFDYNQLHLILKYNNYSFNNDDEQLYGILSKHIINQLNASLGKKIFPEIVNLKSDYI